MASFAYRNKNTGDVYYFSEQNPELEALANWELVEDAEVPRAAELAAERAAQQIKAIEDAATNRLDRTRGAADGDVNRATTREQSSEAGVPVPTLALAAPAGVADQTPLLTPDKVRGASVQIGENPERHPRTREELEAAALYDLEHPPTTGVLGRAKADQHAGRTQIGPNAEAHPAGRTDTIGASTEDTEYAKPGESSGQDLAQPAPELERPQWDEKTAPYASDSEREAMEKAAGANGTGDPTTLLQGANDADTGANDEAGAQDLTEPGGNASRDEWATWVVATGKATEDKVKDVGRNELRETYGSKS